MYKFYRMGWSPLAGTYTFCGLVLFPTLHRCSSLCCCTHGLTWLLEKCLLHVWWITRKSTVVGMGWNMNMHLDALSNMVSQCFTCPWSVASRNRSLPTAEDDTTIHGRRCTKTLAPSSSHDRRCSSPDLVPYCYGYLWINTQRYPRDLAIAGILWTFISHSNGKS